jgi:hypothetical protein
MGRFACNQTAIPVPFAHFGAKGIRIANPILRITAFLVGKLEKAPLSIL